MSGIASVQTATPNAPLYQILFPNGKPYSDGEYDRWPMSSAKHIARNVSRKHSVTTRLVIVQEVIEDDSPFDRIVAYVDTLKGKWLAAALMDHGLPKGGDPVASKRQRLISHMTKCVGHND